MLNGKKVGLIFLVTFGLFFLSMTVYTCNNLRTHVTDNAFNSYEEFQTIYNTCQQVNDNICALNTMREDDKSFDQFSKSSRLLTQRNLMNRWVNEYNAKSKMWNRALWKSKTLPYQLTANDFKCE